MEFKADNDVLEIDVEISVDNNIIHMIAVVVIAAVIWQYC